MKRAPIRKPRADPDTGVDQRVLADRGLGANADMGADPCVRANPSARSDHRERADGGALPDLGAWDRSSRRDECPGRSRGPRPSWRSAGHGKARTRHQDRGLQAQGLPIRARPRQSRRAPCPLWQSAVRVFRVHRQRQIVPGPPPRLGSALHGHKINGAQGLCLQRRGDFFDGISVILCLPASVFRRDQRLYPRTARSETPALFQRASRSAASRP